MESTTSEKITSQKCKEYFASDKKNRLIIKKGGYIFEKWMA